MTPEQIQVIQSLLETKIAENQIDEDGVMIGISRQWYCEVREKVPTLLEYIATLQEEARQLDSSNAEAQRELKKRLADEVQRVKTLEDLINWKNEDIATLNGMLEAEKKRADTLQKEINHLSDLDCNTCPLCSFESCQEICHSQSRFAACLAEMVTGRDRWKEQAEEAEAKISLLPCSICLYAEECVHDKPFPSCKYFDLDEDQVTLKEEEP